MGSRNTGVPLLDAYFETVADMTPAQARHVDNHVLGTLTRRLQELPGGPELFLEVLAEAAEHAETRVSS